MRQRVREMVAVIAGRVNVGKSDWEAVVGLVERLFPHEFACVRTRGLLLEALAELR